MDQQAKMIEDMESANKQRAADSSRLISTMASQQAKVAEQSMRIAEAKEKKEEMNSIKDTISNIDSVYAELGKVTANAKEILNKMKNYSGKVLQMYNDHKKLESRVSTLERNFLKHKKREMQGPFDTASCSGRKSCGVCIQDPKCGWCYAERKCVQGDFVGPIETSCPFFEYSKCSDSICNEITTCSTCTRYSECAWCGATNKCEDKSNKDGIFKCATDYVVKDGKDQCKMGEVDIEVKIKGIMKKYSDTSFV